MDFIIIPLAFIVILLGIGNLMYPKEMLSFSDIFRIRGKRQYTELALIMTRIGGLLAIGYGIYLLLGGSL